MKNLISLIFIVLIFGAFGICQTGYAQTPTDLKNSSAKQEMTIEKYNSKQEVVGKTTLRFPDFKGGLDSLYLFMSENLKYPNQLKSSKLEGTTLVQFMVGIDGEISEISVIRSSGYPEMDEEAIRLVGSFPNWQPASKNGEITAMRTQLPVRFAYSEEESE